MIEACRGHVVRILRTLPEADFSRIGRHNEAGPLTLANLLEKVTDHAIHHAKFIHEKRLALGL